MQHLSLSFWTGEQCELGGDEKRRTDRRRLLVKVDGSADLVTNLECGVPIICAKGLDGRRQSVQPSLFDDVPSLAPFSEASRIRLQRLDIANIALPILPHPPSRHDLPNHRHRGPCDPVGGTVPGYFSRDAPLVLQRHTRSLRILIREVPLFPVARIMGAI